MAQRSTKGSLAGLQSALDPNGLGENAATFDRARQSDDQFYRDALSNATPGVGQAAVMQQQGGVISQDPAMKVFLQAMKERNATIPLKDSGLDLPDSSTELPSTIWDPARQTSAIPPAVALGRLSTKKVKV